MTDNVIINKTREILLVNFDIPTQTFCAHDRKWGDIQAPTISELKRKINLFHKGCEWFPELSGIIKDGVYYDN